MKWQKPEEKKGGDSFGAFGGQFSCEELRTAPIRRIVESRGWRRRRKFAPH